MPPATEKLPAQYTRKEDQRTNLRSGAAGAYARHESGHRNAIKPDSEFPPEAGRYHLHVSLACPWASGALTLLHEKGLDHAISHSVVHPTWSKTKPDDPEDTHCGWVYKAPGDPAIPSPAGYGSFECDDANVPDVHTGVRSIRELYELAGDSEGPFTTPVLWDKKLRKIVNNESMEILPMLNSAFNDFATRPEVDLYPISQAEELTSLNKSTVYPKINNGVYRCGFARSQQAYDTAVTELFGALEEVNTRLSKSRYLSGQTFSWLDLRLYHTLVRFDPVYTTYFKTNEKRIADFPALLGFVRDVYSREAVRRTTNLSHIKMHYFSSHPHLNSFAIVPVHNGPDLEVAHDRDQLGARVSRLAELVARVEVAA